MTDPRPHLRAFLDVCRGEQVSVPRAWLEALLIEPVRPATARDLTVEDLCERYGRKRSTVRAWLEAGRLPGAYKLMEREWRVPPVALEAFDATQRQGKGRAVRGERKPANLAEWRGVRGGQAA